MSFERAQLSVEDKASYFKLEEIFNGAVANLFDGTIITLQITYTEHSPKVVKLFIACCRTAEWIVLEAPIAGQPKIIGRQQQPTFTGIQLNITPTDKARMSVFPFSQG